MAEKQRYDVFLSYSFKDKPWVSEFASALRDAGVKAWFDVSELAPGERWQDRDTRSAQRQQYSYYHPELK